MKKKHAYLKTALWHREKIKDPLQVIAKAFDFADICDFRSMTADALQAANSEKVFSNREPADLLHYFKHLEAIINAAYILVKEKATSPINVQDCDLMNIKYYCGRNKSNSVWDQFPRHLTKKEYRNPYRAFKAFFKFKPIENWKKDLEIITQHALTQYADKTSVDLFSISPQLLKLVEAAHLVDVRETTHIGGFLKDRF